MDLVSRKRSDSSQDQDHHRLTNTCRIIVWHARGCLSGGYDVEYAGKSIGEKGDWDFE